MVEKIKNFLKKIWNIICYPYLKFTEWVAKDLNK